MFVLAVALAASQPLAADPTTRPAAEARPTDARPTDARPTEARPAEAHAATALRATLAAFANTLVEAPSSAAIEPFLCDTPIIREFGRAQQQSLSTLRDRASGATILATRAYPHTPERLAADIAADIADADLPDDVKRRLTPADEKDSRRANLTAARWIADTLSPADGDAIGVIVLWRAAEPDRDAAPSGAGSPDSGDGAPAVRLPLFVLVKSELIDNRYRIRAVCFGDPVTAQGE